MMDFVEQISLRVSTALQHVNGIDAVVIGGSYATGDAMHQSDIDIGIYYGVDVELDVSTLNLVAQKLDDHQRTQLVAPFGGWGEWVNAGAWLLIDGVSVDLILRETQRVANVIEDCESGSISVHYQPGHPHAYINAMYMGELALSRLLWSATTHIPLLKTRAENYPDALQHALLDFFGFEARFSCELAIKTIERDDPYYLTAHCIRAISAMNQVIFALNRQYIINEKKAIVRAMQCLIRPHMYQERVNAVMQTVGAAPDVACSTLSMLIDETTQLIPTQM